MTLLILCFILNLHKLINGNYIYKHICNLFCNVDEELHKVNVTWNVVDEVVPVLLFYPRPKGSLNTVTIKFIGNTKNTQHYNRMSISEDKSFLLSTYFDFFS